MVEGEARRNWQGAGIAKRKSWRCGRELREERF